MTFPQTVELFRAGTLINFSSVGKIRQTTPGAPTVHSASASAIRHLSINGAAILSTSQGAFDCNGGTMASSSATAGWAALARRGC